MIKILASFFPAADLGNIRLFYVLTALSNSWYIAGNWIFYWTRFMTYGELGWLDALAFAFGLVMEVPSGAISDLFGKRRTIIAGLFFSALGTLSMAFANNSTTLWVAFFMVQLGWALYSGAAEALAYDTLLEKKREAEFEKVISTSTMTMLTATVITTLLGGWLYTLHFRLSHLAWGLTYSLAFIVGWWLREPQIDSEHFSFSNYFKQITDGVLQLFKPMLKPYLLVVFATLGFDYLYAWGLVRPVMATQFGFLDQAQAILYAVFGVLAAVIVRFLPLLRERFSDAAGLLGLGVLITAGFLLSALPLGYWGIVAMLCIEVAGYLIGPWFSVMVNREIDSKYRATTLSTLALLTKVPYVVLAVLVGIMAENQMFHWFLLGVGLCCAAAVSITGWQLSRKK